MGLRWYRRLSNGGKGAAADAAGTVAGGTGTGTGTGRGRREMPRYNRGAINERRARWLFRELVGWQVARHHGAVLQFDVRGEGGEAEGFQQRGVYHLAVADVDDVAGILCVAHGSATVGVGIDAYRHGVVDVAVVGATHVVGHLPDGILAVVVPRRPCEDDGGAVAQHLVVDELPVDVHCGERRHQLSDGWVVHAGQILHAHPL